MKYKMVIAYDGTDYGGWQIQANSLSIQEVIESALCKITQKPVSIIGSGRTDSGVHASGQVAHFTTEKTLSLKSLNQLLPKDIRVLSLEEADPKFHARFTAKEKIYLYHVCTDRVQLPLRRRYALHHTYTSDWTKLTTSIPYFLGTHDFSAFANELKPNRDPVKTLFELSLLETVDGFTLKFRGNGFLYKMVRNITGTLLDVARGKLSVEEIPKIFAGGSRTYAGKAAPPHGLFLDKVLY